MHVVVGLIGLVALLIVARTLLGQITGAMGGAPPGTPAEATRFAPVETVAALDPYSHHVRGRQSFYFCTTRPVRSARAPIGG